MTRRLPKEYLGLLHVRGGVSDKIQAHDLRNAVFSTSVEVFLGRYLPIWANKRLLHVRGGVSNDIPHNALDSQSSPRPWRCFWP